MKNFFRFTFFATFFTIFSFSLFSCKNESDDENPSVESVASKGGLIAFYPPNGLGDNSYVDSFCSGVQKAAIKNNLLVYDICPKNWDEAKGLVDEYIPRCYELTKTYKLPVFFLFGDEGYLEFFSPYLSEKPDTISYMLFESKETEFPAVNTAYMPLYGASYLAGLASKTLLAGRENARILAILANESTQSVKDALKGFIAGSESESAWNEKVYDYNFTEWSDSDSTGFKELDFVAISLSNDHDKDGFDSADLSYALALFAQKLNPFDLYFPVCGGSVHGLLRYNREKGEKSFYTVGMDSDLSVYTKQVPFSVVKHIDRAVQKCIEQWLSGKLPHHQEFDLANGYTELIISKSYKDKLSAVVQGALARAIEKEREYEENK